MTFDKCAEAYIVAHEVSWKNEKHRQQWRNTLATYVSPVFGNTPVQDVDIDRVMKVVEPLWSKKTETARRIRGRIEVILDWARVRGYRTGENPARWRGHMDRPVDDHVGAICALLDTTDLAEKTTLIYTSDHGEALGLRGHWGKSNLYNECTQVPLLMSGPSVPRGLTCNTPVNLIDLAPTFLAPFGLSNATLRGRSLFDIARDPPDPDRAAFSEYHAVGAPSGAFMLRKGRWKVP
jgi:Sulfatase